MNSKILLLSIAVISVGLFAMPSTLSLFVGQHTFYTGENVSCQKCHQDIFDEMTSGASQVHKAAIFTSSGTTPGCQGCHRTNTSAITGIPVNGTYTTSTYTLNVTTNPNAHSAVTLECVACHTGVPAELTGSDEAHTIYYYRSLYNPNQTLNPGTVQNQSNVTLKGANTACVGCHTHVAVNISWTRRPGYNMTVDSSTGSWTLTFVVNTTTSSTTYTFGK